MLLVFGLFIVPRALQRFRLPSAVSCVAIGALLNIGFDLFHEDSTVNILATLGIVAMFLFAGLEVDFDVMKRGKKILLQHVTIQLVALFGVAALAVWIFGLGLRAALLFTLALLTPSTGFILDSVDGFGLSEEERFWVKSKAIASELVALFVLFVVVQSTDVRTLALSTVVLAAMIALLPPLFRAFAKAIAPFAPKTEFTFLVLVALLCAFVTRHLGVYYLVGAFVVGVTAVRLRDDLPALSSEKLLGAVELFASFFIPFYFFKSGLHLRPEFFSLRSVGIAGALLFVVLPLRVLRVAAHRRFALREPWRVSLRIGTAVLPTLVFTMVIAEILLDRFALEPELFGALIVFTLVNTLVPGFVLRLPPPAFDAPEVPRNPMRSPDGPSSQTSRVSPST